MKIEAIVLKGGWDYEGTKVLGVFTPMGGELQAFGEMLEAMNDKDELFDYFHIDFYGVEKEDNKSLQYWYKQFQSSSQDHIWVKGY